MRCGSGNIPKIRIRQGKAQMISKANETACKQAEEMKSVGMPIR